ncbi:hypothetical protein DPMN_003842 [Dreissena polymorpha]|uniref:P/Homo B domain-containing protein n=1 Tax=Dreissena polymorpha TaxID=45954 RepID=A0A9D4RSF9_DREPO|nr:hypothetical protein DPMN_003842 [Dreissena polymorpha]
MINVTSFRHGTLCAGVIAAEKGNGVCSAGVAFNATLVALKVFGIEEKYLERGLWEGKQFNYDKVHLALQHKRNEIDIYSSSFNVEEPFIRNELLSRTVLQQGVEQGRHGKGSIYVFSAGNSGDEAWIHDRNLETFANSIYTLVFNSMGINGSRPIYIRKGACILAATVGDHKLLTGEPLRTTSNKNGCKAFSGSSAAAARAAGSIALMLDANSNLTWRDVAYIIVHTSSLDAVKHEQEQTNGAGLKFDSYFGFGLLNETAMVLKAKDWKNVPLLQNMTFSAAIIHNSAHSVKSKVLVHTCKPSSNNCVTNVEQVSVNMKLSSDEASFKATDIILVSPSGTESYVLNHYTGNNTFDFKKQIHETWSFSSVHFWGENAAGEWTINVHHTRWTELFNWNFVPHHAEITFFGYCEICNASLFEENAPSYLLQKISNVYETLPIHTWLQVAVTLVAVAIVTIIFYYYNLFSKITFVLNLFKLTIQKRQVTPVFIPQSQMNKEESDMRSDE